MGIGLHVFDNDTLAPLQGPAARRHAALFHPAKLIEQVRGKAALSDELQLSGFPVGELHGAAVGVEQRHRGLEDFVEERPKFAVRRQPAA